MAKRASDAVVEELRAYGLALPGASLKSPWPGHKDLAVNDKTFAYLSIEGEEFSIGCKLPQSNSVALMLPFATPMEYGLGKSGWVTAKFPTEPPPVEMLKAWIDESYRAQAPKKLLAQLGAPAPAAAAKPDATPSSKKPANKPAAKTVAAKKPANKPATPSSKKPANKPAAKTVAAKKPANKPAAKSSSTKPANKPAAKTVAAKTAAAKKPAKTPAAKPVSKKPAAKAKRRA